MQSSNKQSQYFESNYYNQLPNDGIFVNPMRNNFAPPSPSESGESFFLHDPHEVIYNRVKDIFESDTSGREESFGKMNAMTVKAEIHSSSGGSTSDEDAQELMMIKSAADKNNNFSDGIMTNHHHNSNHDYEDIYLVREEAKTTSKVSGRSRSRDSGSHSRSASTSSTRSHEVIVQTKIIVSN
jgi:espin